MSPFSPSGDLNHMDPTATIPWPSPSGPFARLERSPRSAFIIGETALEPRAFRTKRVRWVNLRLGVTSTGPNTDTGEIAPRLVVDGRIEIDGYVTHELSGLGSFEEAVAITLDKPAHDALWPAQIVV